jgi:hypothetical protein
VPVVGVRLRHNIGQRTVSIEGGAGGYPGMSRPLGQQRWWRRGGALVLIAVTATSLSVAAGVHGSGPASAQERAPGHGSVSSTKSTLSLKVKPHKVHETMATGLTAVLSVHDGKFAAAEPVVISSQQLQTVCPDGVTYTDDPVSQANSIEIILDKDGNGTVTLTSPECAPGAFTILANLQDPPYDTAKATMHVFSVKPPKQMTLAVTPNPVVESGSEIDEQVTVQSPNAEEQLRIGAPQLQSQCQSLTFTTPGGATTANTVTETVNIDYQATVTLKATDCPSGNFVITGDILSPPYATATSVLQVEAPPS